MNCKKTMLSLFFVVCTACICLAPAGCARKDAGSNTATQTGDQQPAMKAEDDGKNSAKDQTPDKCGANPANPEAAREEIYHDAVKRVGEKHFKFQKDKEARAVWEKQWQSKYEGKLNTADELTRALEQMMESVGDYVYLDTTANAPADSGIGIMVAVTGGLTFDKEIPKSERFIAAEVFPDTPAAKAGMLDGDTIVKVDGKTVSGSGHTARDVVKMLRGKSGTTVSVLIERNGKQQSLEITRAPVSAPAVVLRMEGSAAYLRLRDLAADTFTKELSKALAQIDQGKASSLLLDLRNVSGGPTGFALEAVQMLLPQGIVMQRLMAENEPVTFFLNETHDFRTGVVPLKLLESKTTSLASFLPRTPLALKRDLALVVLVNGKCHGSGEIVAGALKANKRAVLVGQKTGGSLAGRLTEKLPGGRNLAITTEYYIPGALAANASGVTPDVMVPDHQTGGEDIQLKTARAMAERLLKARADLEALNSK